jgi:hypothetical protein
MGKLPKDRSAFCVAKVYRQFSESGRCSNRARKGSEYCRVHDPEVVQARHDARLERYRRRWANDEWRNDLKKAKDDAADLLVRMHELGADEETARRMEAIYERLMSTKPYPHDR